VKLGDRVLYYHTGKEKAVVGEMEVVQGPMPEQAPGADAKAVVVQVRPVKRRLRPVTLTQIKHEPLLASWELVRIPRLSVMAVSPAQWQHLEELAGELKSAVVTLRATKTAGARQ